MKFATKHIPTDHRKFILAQMSIPAAPNSPVAIILPGMLGVNGAVLSLAEKLSDHGFACCLPTSGADAQESNSSPSQSIRDPENSWGLQELSLAIRHMRSASETNGKIAVIGFGKSGQQAYLAACRLDPEAVIIYHGKGIDAFLEEGQHIQCPTVFHAGKNDPYMKGETDRRIHAALIGKFNIAIYKYDAGDAFTNKNDPVNYVPEAARLANKRTLDVLYQLK